jgi:pimeloyl-ACP methyl ester carboxylesterase
MRCFNFITIILCLLYTGKVTAQLTVNCQGTGQPVYLVGGGPAFTTWNLEPIQQRLSEHYRVCRWDMRGVGENAELESDQYVPVLQQWLNDMAEVLPDEPVVLWGHSWGALQSLLFARQYRHRVKALVLNNPVDPELKSLENIELNRYVHPYVESHLKIEDIDTPAEQRHRFRSKIASYFLDAKEGWAYSAQFNDDDVNNRLNVQIWQEYREMNLKNDDFQFLAPDIERLIYCKYDVLMPKNYIAYADMLSADKHHIIENCAHFPWVESPEEFYRVLLQAITDAFQHDGK